MATDPVWSMQVERTGPPLDDNRTTRWFCADGCRKELIGGPT